MAFERDTLECEPEEHIPGCGVSAEGHLSVGSIKRGGCREMCLGLEII